MGADGLDVRWQAGSPPRHALLAAQSGWNGVEVRDSMPGQELDEALRGHAECLGRTSALHLVPAEEVDERKLFQALGIHPLTPAPGG